MRGIEERHASRREIADLADGTLAGPRGERVRAHVAEGCDACAAALVGATNLRALLREGPLPPPPAAALRQAKLLFRTAQARALVGRVREVLASLVLDQRLAPAAALRGAPGSARRLLWTFDGVEVVATLVLGATARMTGQVLPADDADDAAPTGAVRAERDGVALASATLDDEGGFSFGSLPAGTYVLAGTVGSTAFRTPPFLVD